MSIGMKKSIIFELSKTLGVSVRAVDIRDPNVFEREQRASKKVAENLSFRYAVRFQCEGLKAEVRSNGLYLVLEVKANLNAGSWSINEPDQIIQTRRWESTSRLVDGMPLFITGAEPTDKAREIMESRALSALLKMLKLSDCESLHFYKNAIVYYSRSADAAEFIKKSQAICSFIARARESKAMMRIVELPEPFSDLNEYGQEWAISDDSEREEAIDKASLETLQRLVEHVAPRLPSINSYLDTHTDEKAAVLGRLAETVAEAQIALQSATDGV